MSRRYNEKLLIIEALKHYDTADKPFDLDEFRDDLGKITYICKYLKTFFDKTINHRMVLNYFVIIINTFGSHSPRFVFEVAEEVIFPQLLAVFHFFNLVPLNNKIDTVTKGELDLTAYATDTVLLDAFRREIK